MSLWFVVFRLRKNTFRRLSLPTGIAFVLCLNIAYATYPPTFSDCLMGDGEEYDQVDACQQLLRSNSKNYDLHVALGKTLDKRQKYKQALEAYRKALLVFSKDDYFLKKYSIAESNLKEQQWLLNKKQGRETSRYQSANSGSSSRFKLDKIRCTRLTGKVALAACQKAIKINDKDAALFISIGDIYASQQNNGKAVVAYKRAVELNPKDIKTPEKLKKLLQRQEIAKQKFKQNKLVKQTKYKANKKTTAVVINKAVAETKAPLKTNKPVSVNKTNKKIVSAKAKNSKPVSNVKLRPEQQQFLQQLSLLRSLKERQIISQSDYEQRKKALLDSTFKVASDSDKGSVINKIKTPDKKPKQIFKDLDFGNYHALIIGNNQYKYLPELQTAVNDANSLAELLKRHYGFKVKLLLNANRYDILKAMGKFRNTLTKEDNLLIYYAGHGVLDKASERGYWLPVDAELDFTSNWISTAEVTDTLKALQSWHVLVVADSCYSGTLVRSTSVNFINPEKKYSLIKRLLKKKSRTVITSGGLEPVTDSGRDDHSVFSGALLEVLENTDYVIEAEAVFSRLRDSVILNADQTPEYSNVRKVGHNGGDFIFLRQ